MPDGEGRTIILAHLSTGPMFQTPRGSKPMTVSLNRRSIRLPTGFLDNGVEGSTNPLLCGWYVRHKSRKRR
jgi:hypothetical protein